jgi:DNA primase small subunit
MVEVRTDILRRWSKAQTSSERWAIIYDEIDFNLKSKTKDRKLMMCQAEIEFQLLYPRLDAQVSMHLNHLLKAPFCIHPKTGRVCVPIRISDVDKFDPMEVPLVSQLVKELNQYDREHPDATDESGKKLAGWKKTALKESIAVFDEFLNGIEGEIRNKMAAKRGNGVS